MVEDIEVSIKHEIKMNTTPNLRVITLTVQKYIKIKEIEINMQINNIALEPLKITISSIVLIFKKFQNKFRELL